MLDRRRRVCFIPQTPYMFHYVYGQHPRKRSCAKSTLFYACVINILRSRRLDIAGVTTASTQDTQHRHRKKRLPIPRVIDESAGLLLSILSSVFNNVCSLVLSQVKSERLNLQPLQVPIDAYQAQICNSICGSDA
jgi:hypothetical protein